MPKVSVLSQPPPPGSVAEPPVPGSVPKLSLTTSPDKSGSPRTAPVKAPPPKGLVKKPKEGAGPPLKVAVKPPGEKAPKPASLLQKRPTLSPIVKAGIAVAVIAVAIGGIYTYRIFFASSGRDVQVKIPVLAKVTPPPSRNVDEPAKTVVVPGDDSAAPTTPTPTPTPEVESVMVNTKIASDVQVNSTHIEVAHAASADFRAFVANASIGGVFQGKPSRALINGVIVREGQVIDSVLLISFERIDSANKVIYFKDASGAEVSKNY
jgi:hypothetical protein